MLQKNLPAKLKFSVAVDVDLIYLLFFKQFDITFPAVPCSLLSLDARDISGEEHFDIVCDPHNLTFFYCFFFCFYYNYYVTFLLLKNSCYLFHFKKLAATRYIQKEDWLPWSCYWSQTRWNWCSQGLLVIDTICFAVFRYLFIYLFEHEGLCIHECFAIFLCLLVHMILLLNSAFMI